MAQRNTHIPAPQEADAQYQRISIDFAAPELANTKVSPRKVVILRADGIGPARVAKAFMEHDHLDGCLRGAASIVLTRGAPARVPTLVSPAENLVVVVTPARRDSTSDAVFSLMWRHACAAMVGRSDATGFRAAVFPGGMLSLRSDVTLPSGRFEFFATADWLAELPASVVDDLATIATRDPAGLLN